MWRIKRYWLHFTRLALLQAFKAAEVNELKAMKHIRNSNKEKLPYMDRAVDEAKRLHQAKNVRMQYMYFILFICSYTNL